MITGEEEVPRKEEVVGLPLVRAGGVGFASTIVVVVTRAAVVVVVEEVEVVVVVVIVTVVVGAVEEVVLDMVVVQPVQQSHTVISSQRNSPRDRRRVTPSHGRVSVSFCEPRTSQLVGQYSVVVVVVEVVVVVVVVVVQSSRSQASSSGGMHAAPPYCAGMETMNDRSRVPPAPHVTEHALQAPQAPSQSTGQENSWHP